MICVYSFMPIQLFLSWCAMSTDTNLVDVGMTFWRIQRKVNPNRFSHKHADTKNYSTLNFWYYISDHHSQPSTKHPPQNFSIPKAAKLAIQKTSANRMIVFIKWLQKKQRLQKIKFTTTTKKTHHQPIQQKFHPGGGFKHIFFSKKAGGSTEPLPKMLVILISYGSMWLVLFTVPTSSLENQPCHVGR